jgi:hypothetical protein|tara:strand:- start:319 stop:561 length:243 start_codon:yes stop_codon:yes gene_type:complete
MKGYVMKDKYIRKNPIIRAPKGKWTLHKDSVEYMKLLDELFLPKDVTQVELIDALLDRVMDNDSNFRDINRMKLTTWQRK